MCDASTHALQGRLAKSTSLQPPRVTSLLQKVCCFALWTLSTVCTKRCPAYLPGGKQAAYVEVLASGGLFASLQAFDA